MVNESYMLQTLERSVAVIEALALKIDGCGVTELSKETQINKSTVFRILYTLMKKGYVEQIPKSENYRLSTKVLHLGSCVLNRMDLRPIAKPYLQNLLNVTKETVHLGIFENNEVVYIEKFESIEHSIRMYSQIGKRLPMHCSAMGKIFLSGFSDEIIKEKLKDAALKKYTNSTITDLEDLINEVSKARRDGYIFDNEEHEVGIKCIAAPIYDSTNLIVASISISIPIIYYSDERIPFIIEELSKASKSISYQLGFKN